MRLPGGAAAASKRKKVAAADMSSTEPAWMPPIQWVDQDVDDPRPELAGDQWSDGAVAERAPHVGTGESASRASPSCPRRPRMPAGPSARSGWGSPSAWPRAGGAAGPAAQTDAPRAAIGTRSSPRPTSRQSRRPQAGGRETRRARVDEPVAEHSLPSGPPRRRRRSSTTTAGARRGPPPPVSSQAAARPLIPPPTTIDRPRCVAHRASVGGGDDVGQHVHERWVVVRATPSGA